MVFSAEGLLGEIPPALAPGQGEIRAIRAEGLLGTNHGKSQRASFSGIIPPVTGPTRGAAAGTETCKILSRRKHTSCRSKKKSRPN